MWWSLTPRGTRVTTLRPSAESTVTVRGNAATFTASCATSLWRRRSTTDRSPNRACPVSHLQSLGPTAVTSCLVFKPSSVCRSDRVVDDLNPVLNFTRREVESLLHFVEEEPDPDQVRLKPSEGLESVLRRALHLFPHLVTKVRTLRENIQSGVPSSGGLQSRDLKSSQD